MFYPTGAVVRPRTMCWSGPQMKNVNPKIVQEMIGHATITQTMDTYSHLIDDIGGDAVDGLDEAFG